MKDGSFMVAPKTSKRRIARGWWWLAAAFTAYLVLGVLDQELKYPPHPGYVPAEAAWVAAAPDFPHAWTAAYVAPWCESVREEAFRHLHAAELAVRKATGIRPTPARWRVWMGPNIWVGIKDRAWGLCVRPGLLMRAAHFVHRVFSRENGSGSIYVFGDFHYAWRNGFLIASPSIQYVREALSAPPCVIRGAETAMDGVTVGWKGSLPGWALLRPDTPQVQGAFFVPARVDGEGLELGCEWPEPPLFSVAAQASLPILLPLWEAIRDPIAASDAIACLPPLPELWDLTGLPPVSLDGVQETAIAVYLDDTNPGWPVPEIAAAFKTSSPPPAGRHPLASLLEEDEGMTYAWGDRTGWILPLWGEVFTLCAAASGPYWLAASRESRMARVVVGPTRDIAPGRVATVQADWAKISGAVQAILRRAATLGLIPRRNARDVESELIPLARIPEQWGKLRIDLYGAGAELRFKGDIARPLEAGR